MNAEEALARAKSDEVQSKIRAEKEKRCKIAMSDILMRIEWAVQQGNTHIIYDWSNLDELDAFDLLKAKNYKVRPVWYHLLSEVKISWKHALTKPYNDVMKGIVGKPTLWERIKGWFK